MAPDAGGFRLEKTYLDVVSPEGDVAIAYDLSLRWGRLRLAAASVSVSRRTGEDRSRTAIGTTAVREAAGGGWTFASSRLAALGRWDGGRAGPTVTLPADGPVRWTPVAMAVAAEVTVAGRRVEGLGYVERLELGIEPWRLPMGILRWGRFIADGGESSATWISWRDAADRRSTLELAIVDGERAEDSEATARRVTWRGGSLEIDAVRTLRDAPLAQGPAALVARFLPGMPGRFLRAHERKRLARGTLRRGPHAMPVAGFVIDEEVRFPTVGR